MLADEVAVEVHMVMWDSPAAGGSGVELGGDGGWPGFWAETDVARGKKTWTRVQEGVDTCRDPFMHAAELATPTSLSHKRVALAQSFEIALGKCYPIFL
jgi:hypothetical protein